MLYHPMKKGKPMKYIALLLLALSMTGCQGGMKVACGLEYVGQWQVPEDF